MGDLWKEASVELEKERTKNRKRDAKKADDEINGVLPDAAGQEVNQKW